MYTDTHILNQSMAKAEFMLNTFQGRFETVIAAEAITQGGAKDRIVRIYRSLVQLIKNLIIRIREYIYNRLRYDTAISKKLVSLIAEYKKSSDTDVPDASIIFYCFDKDDYIKYVDIISRMFYYLTTVLPNQFSKNIHAVLDDAEYMETIETIYELIDADSDGVPHISERYEKMSGDSLPTYGYNTKSDVLQAINAWIKLNELYLSSNKLPAVLDKVYNALDNAVYDLSVDISTSREYKEDITDKFNELAEVFKNIRTLLTTGRELYTSVTHNLTQILQHINRNK